MNKLKITARLLCIITAVSVMLTAFTVFASAESLFARAKALTSGKKYTIDFDYYEDERYDGLLYKINADAGELKIKLETSDGYGSIAVMNSKSQLIDASKCTTQTGEADIYEENNSSGIEPGYRFESNYLMEEFKGTVTYTLTKGTYYILIDTTCDIISFTATYKVYTAPVKINSLCLTVPKGSAVKLGSVLTAATDKTVTWTSSKTSVAAVTSKGKVTAKSAGTAVITAKLGSSSVKITIKVT